MTVKDNDNSCIVYMGLGTTMTNGKVMCVSLVSINVEDIHSFHQDGISLRSQVYHICSCNSLSRPRIPQEHMHQW